MIIIDDDGVMHKVFTKDEVIAMLTDIQLEIEESENCGKAFHLGLQMASNIIQQKIDKLKENTDGNKND